MSSGVQYTTKLRGWWRPCENLVTHCMHQTCILWFLWLTGMAIGSGSSILYNIKTTLSLAYYTESSRLPNSGTNTQIDEITNTEKWAADNNLTLNHSNPKSKGIIFKAQPLPPPCYIEWVSDHSHTHRTRRHRQRQTNYNRVSGHLLPDNRTPPDRNPRIV